MLLRSSRKRLLLFLITVTSLLYGAHVGMDHPRPIGTVQRTRGGCDPVNRVVYGNTQERSSSVRKKTSLQYRLGHRGNSHEEDMSDVGSRDLHVLEDIRDFSFNSRHAAEVVLNVSMFDNKVGAKERVQKPRDPQIMPGMVIQAEKDIHWIKDEQHVHAKSGNNNVGTKSNKTESARNVTFGIQNENRVNETKGWLQNVTWEPFIDAHNYSYLINPLKACRGEKDLVKMPNLTVIVLVASAPGNGIRRQELRRTWISGIREHNVSARAIFLLGASRLGAGQPQIYTEATEHGDILQEDFVDSYHNLSIKTVMGLKWAAAHCSNAAFVMKTDDDVVINIVALARDLATAPPKLRRNYAAGMQMLVKPIRKYWSKWYTPVELFSEDTYPPYPQGHGYIVSLDLAARLAKAAEAEPLFLWEDVYVGILLARLGVGLRHRSSFTFTHCLYNTGPLIQTNTTLMALQRGYLTWDLYLEEYGVVWRAIQTGRWPQERGQDRPRPHNCSRLDIEQSAYLP